MNVRITRASRAPMSCEVLAGMGGLFVRPNVFSSANLRPYCDSGAILRPYPDRGAAVPRRRDCRALASGGSVS